MTVPRRPRGASPTRQPTADAARAQLPSPTGRASSVSQPADLPQTPGGADPQVWNRGMQNWAVFGSGRVTGVWDRVEGQEFGVSMPCQAELVDVS